MAGMDWFRWHHGSVTDPKFQLIAKKTNCRVADVIAVWAFILESASQSNDRGNYGELDFESIDCALGLDDGQAQAIHTAMGNRSMVSDDGRVASWEKRQPKREREDDNSTERSRAFRQSKRQTSPNNTNGDNATPKQANSGNATPCNAMQRQETPRVEESRGDKRNTGGERERARAPEVGGQSASPHPPNFPTEDRDFCKTERPDLDPDRTRASFCDHYTPEKQTQANWRKWVRREVRSPVAGVDLSPASVASDPDSRASVEALGLAFGFGRWDSLAEQWPAYKARVKTAQFSPQKGQPCH